MLDLDLRSDPNNADSVVAAGGGEAAVMTSTVWVGLARIDSGALIRRLSTTGAPQKCVTPWSRMASKIPFASTRRRHTLVPSIAAMVHGKHQPLQWYIGRVQR